MNVPIFAVSLISATLTLKAASSQMSDFWKIDFCNRYKIFCEAVRNLLTQLDNRYEVMAPLQKNLSILKKIPFILRHPVCLQRVDWNVEVEEDNKNYVLVKYITVLTSEFLRVIH